VIDPASVAIFGGVAVATSSDLDEALQAALLHLLVSAFGSDRGSNGVLVRIPTKPVTDSDLNPAICSDLKSARIPI
jgi:hypothetical protein